MIASISLQIDSDVLQAVNRTADKAPGLMKTAYKRQIRSLTRRIKARLSTYPIDQPELPFIWSYDPEKQARARRYYFAVIVPKKSRGGRYRRTGALGRAWKVLAEANDYSGFIAMQNDAPGAEYVQADYQVPSHYLTGWPNVNEVAAEYQQIATDEVISIWYTVVSPEAA